MWVILIFFFPKKLSFKHVKKYFDLWPHHAAHGILVPQPRIEPVNLQWKYGVPATGLPGKSSWDLTLNQDSARVTELACLYMSAYSRAVSLTTCGLKPKFICNLLCFKGNTYLIFQMKNYIESVFQLLLPSVYMPPC